MKKAHALTGIAALCCVGSIGNLQAASSPQYRLAAEQSIPGNAFWDYLTVDASDKRLYVTHGTRVQVLDTQSGKVVGEILDTPGVHGVAVARELGRGYVSAGRSNKVVVFDLKTLKRLDEIDVTGANPDAILYDAFSRKVFTFNGRGRNSTIIDAKTDKAIGSIALDAKPEFAVNDLAGHVYVNLEDRHSIAVLDTTHDVVQKILPIAGCKSPTGLAIDRAHRRLFSVCSNKVMIVVDADTGREVATLPIGAYVDGAAFDDAKQLAFATGGDGTLTIVREETPDSYAVVQTLPTRPGARTIAVDPTSHWIYTATAKFVASKSSKMPAMVPDSFAVLIAKPL